MLFGSSVESLVYRMEALECPCVNKQYPTLGMYILPSVYIKPVKSACKFISDTMKIFQISIQK